MSGGALDYVSGRIEYAAGAILDWIRERQEDKPNEFGWKFDWTPHPYYRAKHPDVPYIQTAKALKAKTLKLMEATAKQMELAAKMAHEAEWMMSDDTGPETFCREVEKAVVEWMDAGYTEEKAGNSGQCANCLHRGDLEICDVTCPYDDGLHLPGDDAP